MSSSAKRFWKKNFRSTEGCVHIGARGKSWCHCHMVSCSCFYAGLWRWFKRLMTVCFFTFKWEMSGYTICTKCLLCHWLLLRTEEVLLIQKLVRHGSTHWTKAKTMMNTHTHTQTHGFFCLSQHVCLFLLLANFMAVPSLCKYNHYGNDFHLRNTVTSGMKNERFCVRLGTFFWQQMLEIGSVPQRRVCLGKWTTRTNQTKTLLKKTKPSSLVPEAVWEAIVRKG